MNIPDNLLYTKEHEWVKIEGKNAVMGITDYAQSSLGDITFIEVPKTGAAVKQFQQAATVESVKAASDVYAPLSGKVIKSNDNLKNSPETVNQSPYDNGWFCVIEMTNPVERSALLSPADYKKHVEAQSK